MKTASAYRKHAQECRVLAKQMPSGEQREQLLEMARTWDALATSRETMVRHSEPDPVNPSNEARPHSKQ
jgi:hypothetical protein